MFIYTLPVYKPIGLYTVGPIHQGKFVLDCVCVCH